jgi:hypothetical protein
MLSVRVATTSVATEKYRWINQLLAHIARRNAAPR